MVGELWKFRPDVWRVGRGGSLVTMEVMPSFVDDLESDIVDAGGAGITPVTRLSVGLVHILCPMTSWNLACFASSSANSSLVGIEPERAWQRNDHPEARWRFLRLRYCM
jgi:hypothetical protein